MELGESYELGPVIAGLQAAQIAHSTLLRALITTHPHYKAFMEQWLALSSAQIADAMQQKVSGAPAQLTNQALLEELAGWTRRLEKYSPGA